ncbi:putative vacuolar protein sorting-associated protein [Helianthus annuus]|nr:putative vacuolar protein sorting-associated protein [Helianthus annuus]
MRAKKMESITLFVASLNNRKRYSTNGKCDKRYLYFFDKGNTQITVASIHGPIELVITTEIQRDTATSDPTVDVFFSVQSAISSRKRPRAEPLQRNSSRSRSGLFSWAIECHSKFC